MDLLSFLALAALVLIFAGLTEGLVSRAPISFPMIFLGLGYLLGSAGVISTDPHSKRLEAVAVVTLALVLFLDAVRMRFDRSPSEWLVPSLVLGPGTILCVLLVAATSHFLFGLGVEASLLLGAVLSSTDPVVVRDIVRDRRIPTEIRQSLTTEAATNDVVVLPVVLVLIAIANAEASNLGGWALVLGKLFVLGPAIGFAIGASGAWLMSRMDRKFGIRREYQSLYGLGLVFASYSGAEAVGGDGFLACFAAGAAIAALDLELCDCFMEFGDATAEMIMLFAFIMFGGVLSALVPSAPLGAALALAAVTLFVARPAAVAIVLRKAAISRSASAFIGWFGPRGLASLLLALLAVRAGFPNGGTILAIAGVVVTVSVVLHGVTATPLTGWYAKRFTSLLAGAGKQGDVPLADASGLAERLRSSDAPVVLDVRTESSFEKDPETIPGALHVPPDQIESWAEKRPRDRWIVTYCT